MNKQAIELLSKLREAKKREDRANADRVALETQLITLLSFVKPEGSETQKYGDFKVTLTNKLNRTVDAVAWSKIKELVPLEMQGVIEVDTKLKVNNEGARWIEQNAPDIWEICQQAISVKPVKTAVKVEVVL